MSPIPTCLKITHFASGDIWAGAEKQLYTLVTNLSQDETNHLTVVLMNEGELADRLRESDITVTVFDECTDNDLVIFIKILLYLHKYKPDITHTHGHKENILVSIASLLNYHAVNVRTIHGAPEHIASGFRQLHKVIFRKLDNFTGEYLATRIVAVTEDLREKLEAIFSKEKLVTIVNGIDIKDPPVEYISLGFRKSMPNKYHIGIAGRLYQVKRVDIFLQTARLLCDNAAEQYHFHVIGDGPLKEEHEQLAKNLGIEDNVTFHGHRQEMNRYLANLDLLIICSDHEGMPMVALESVVIGTPVMAHAVGGLKILLEKYSNQLLIDKNLAESYVKKIEKYFQHENKRLIQDLIENVRQKYSATGNSEKWSKLYKSLIQKS